MVFKTDENNPDGKNEQIKRMFNSISDNYDLLNHVLSFNIDRYWRHRLIRMIVRDLHISHDKVGIHQYRKAKPFWRDCYHLLWDKIKCEFIFLIFSVILFLCLLRLVKVKSCGFEENDSDNIAFNSLPGIFPKRQTKESSGI